MPLTLAIVVDNTVDNAVNNAVEYLQIPFLAARTDLVALLECR